MNLLLLLMWCVITLVAGLTEFPNPRKEWDLCGRLKASFVCDPDSILDRGRAEKLDQLAREFLKSTSCLCPQCDSGVSLGIFLRQNLTQESMKRYENGKILAEVVRKRWNLGKCNDDIIIILLVQQNISEFSMGKAVQNVFPEKTAEQIMKECQFHFQSGWFYQGLESIVNSFSDVLVELQRQKKKTNRNLVIGVALGTGVFLILIVTAIVLVHRQSKLRRQFCENVYGSLPRRNNRKVGSHEKKNKQQLEKLTKPVNSDEEEELTDIILQSKLSVPIVQYYRPRQLSDVPELSEDIEGTEDNRCSNSNEMQISSGKKKNLQVTEL